MPIFDFVKAVVSGNDFVLAEYMEFSKEEIKNILDRHYGIGGDGLILYKRNRMQFFNPDGSRAEFCGNGTLALAEFLFLKGEKIPFIETDAGEVEVNLENKQISIRLPEPEIICEEPLVVKVGVPHMLIPAGELDSVDVIKNGEKFSKFLEEKNNVDWIKVVKEGIKIRTYERGVEGETLSCGSGVGASGFWYSNYSGKKRFSVSTKGGNYRVNTEGGIWISSTVAFPFSGTYKGGQVV